MTEGGSWAVISGAVTGHNGNSAGGFLRKYLGFRGFTVVPGAVRELNEDETDREVHAILRAMFASGVFDRIKSFRAVDYDA